MSAMKQKASGYDFQNKILSATLDKVTENNKLTRFISNNKNKIAILTKKGHSFIFLFFTKLKLAFNSGELTDNVSQSSVVTAFKVVKWVIDTIVKDCTML